MEKSARKETEADPPIRIAFADLEASGLMEGGFPIEIAWVDRDGRGETHLIRPAPGWTAWSRKAEKVHHITRQQLQCDGRPHDEVAHRVVAALQSAIVYVDAPDFGGPWIRTPLKAARIRANLNIHDAAEALISATRPLDALITSPPRSLKRIWERHKVSNLESRILPAAFDHAEKVAPRTHRALDDARRLWIIWHEIERRVTEEVGRIPA